MDHFSFRVIILLLLSTNIYAFGDPEAKDYCDGMDAYTVSLFIDATQGVDMEEPWSEAASAQKTYIIPVSIVYAMVESVYETVYAAKKEQSHTILPEIRKDMSIICYGNWQILKANAEKELLPNS